MKSVRVARFSDVRFLLLGGLLTVVAGGITLLRPAKVRNAKVTTVSPGNSPIASVALMYGAGVRPTSLIVDIFLQNGDGSATIGGDQLFVDIPLIGSSNMHRYLVTTATYHILGRWYTVVQAF